MGLYNGSGIKRTKYDKLFSELVRERADWICENPGCKKDFKHNRGGLHNAHIFGRRRQGTRIHPDNAFAHCAGCHQKLESEPITMAELARAWLGEDRYNRLILLANKPTKMTTFDKEIIHKHYLKEKKRLLALRKDGVQGRIEFTLP
jgi:hypothetical protein